MRATASVSRSHACDALVSRDHNRIHLRHFAPQSAYSGTVRRREAAARGRDNQEVHVAQLVLHHLVLLLLLPLPLLLLLVLLLPRSRPIHAHVFASRPLLARQRPELELNLRFSQPQARRRAEKQLQPEAQLPEKLGGGAACAAAPPPASACLCRPRASAARA
jgi:hypothetical protein